MIETPQESQGVMQGGADAPGTSILQETYARTNFQGENVRKEGFPAPQDVLTLISTMYLKSIKPSTPEEFNAFIVYMEKVRQVIVVDKKPGSLKIILECTSLEILRSWNVGDSAIPSLQQILSLLASKYLNNLNPSTPEDFNGFVRYMKKVREVS